MKLILPKDLQDSCLTNPYDGPRRKVWYLDDLWTDIDRIGLTLYWRFLPTNQYARCNFRLREIYLSPALFPRGPVRVRWSITHEIAHFTGKCKCEECALRRQQTTYGPVLFLEYMAA